MARAILRFLSYLKRKQKIKEEFNSLDESSEQKVERKKRQLSLQERLEQQSDGQDDVSPWPNGKIPYKLSQNSKGLGK